MNIYEKLLAVQNELKVPKNQLNKFGGYNYRSCEDILETVKPLLAKNKLMMFLDDNVVTVGGRVYIEATATLIDTEGDVAATITNSAYAREPEQKKGMDDSQITGTASSYARKYALNGLFLIDDTKDADTEEYTKAAKNGDKATAGTNTKAAAKSEPKPPVISGKVPPATMVLNNEGNYVALEKLPTEVLQKISTMAMYKPAWTDIKAVIAERTQG